jgi:cytochrome c2
MKSSHDAGGSAWLSWSLLSLCLVLLLPPQAWLDQPLWAVPTTRLPQVLAGGLAFAVFAFLQAVRSPRTRRASWGWRAVDLLLFGALAQLPLLTHPELPFSRGMLLLLTVLSLALVALRSIVCARKRLVVAALTVGVVASAALGLVDTRASGSAPPRVLASAVHVLSMTYLTDLVGPMVMDGGGITANGSGFLLATGDGELYELEWTGRGDTLSSAKVALAPPFDRRAFLGSWGDSATAPRLRVTDILMDGPGERVFLAHQSWHEDARCFTMRISSTPLHSSPATLEGWRNEWESNPCLAFGPIFDDIETGGRLAWLDDGRLIVTVGDHGFNGVDGQALSQEAAADYGKVLVVTPGGPTEVLSIGHRNPQGLLIDEGGRIWVTEHGPEGGDELNLITAGGNYGWPLVTYGTEYGGAYWPLSPNARDHGSYIEPTLAFQPSIGISNLIQVGGYELPRWESDFLIASLRARAVYRMRLVDQRAVYAEPIDIGREVRDLVQAPDGRVVLWTDEGEVVVIGRASDEAADTEMLFRQCAVCHEPQGGLQPSGPSLRGVLGRPIGREPGFTYSDVLSQVGGVWTVERLDEFLADPEAFAPGTSMQSSGVPSSEDRQAIVDFLAGYR